MTWALGSVLRTAIGSFVLFLMFACFSAPLRAEPVDVEQQKIDYLIGEVAKLKGAHFIRNGAEFDVGKAVEHLQLKRRSAGARVKTAEDFIRYCATQSSMSGEKYRIRFASGETVDSAAFFEQRLAAYASK